MDDAAKPTVRGPTKFFFEDENIDRLFAMTMTLGAEISAVGEKLDTVVRLLSRSEVLDGAAVDGYEPDAEAQAQRDAARKVFVQGLLAPFQQEADALVERVAAKRRLDRPIPMET